MARTASASWRREAGAETSDLRWFGRIASGDNDMTNWAGQENGHRLLLSTGNGGDKIDDRIIRDR